MDVCLNCGLPVTADDYRVTPFGHRIPRHEDNVCIESLTAALGAADDVREAAARAYGVEIKRLHAALAEAQRERDAIQRNGNQIIAALQAQCEGTTISARRVRDELRDIALALAEAQKEHAEYKERIGLAIDQACAEYEVCREKLTTAQRERDEARGDAERYRWFRANGLSLTVQSGKWNSGVTDYHPALDKPELKPVCIDAFIDAHIDAVRASGAETGGEKG